MEASTTGLPTLTSADLYAEDGRPIGFLIPDQRISAVQSTIAKLNRRLQKAGADQDTRFELTIIPTLFRANDGETSRTNHVTVQRPLIQIGPWQFGATVTTTDGQRSSPVMITGPAAGTDLLAGYTVTDPTECEHCGAHRSRRKTYLLVDPATGDIKQVGSTCLQPFLGVQVNGILRWAESDVDKMISEDLDDGERFSTPGDHTTAVREVIAAALAVTEGGRRYISRDRADYGQRATADALSSALVEIARGDRDVLELVAEYAPKETVTEVIEYARTMEGATDYVDNVRKLAASEVVLTRHVGTLGSVVASWHRSKTPAPAKAADGYAAAEGTRFKDHPLTVKVARISYYETPYGSKALVVMRDAEEHEIIWHTQAGGDDLQAGESITLVGGSVKEHGLYKAVPQTVVTRVKYTRTT